MFIIPYTTIQWNWKVTSCALPVIRRRRILCDFSYCLVSQSQAWTAKLTVSSSLLLTNLLFLGLQLLSFEQQWSKKFIEFVFRLNKSLPESLDFSTMKCPKLASYSPSPTQDWINHLFAFLLNRFLPSVILTVEKANGGNGTIHFHQSVFSKDD